MVANSESREEEECLLYSTELFIYTQELITHTYQQNKSRLYTFIHVHIHIISCIILIRILIRV